MQLPDSAQITAPPEAQAAKLYSGRELRNLCIDVYRQAHKQGVQDAGRDTYNEGLKMGYMAGYYAGLREARKD